MAAAEPGLTDIEQKLDALDKQIEETESQQEEEFKKFRDDCQSEIKKKLDSYGQGMQHKIDMSFNSLDERMNDYNKSDIKNRQTDILRLNRIIRDTAKGIAKDWKRVYRDLMALDEVPTEEVQKMMKKFEKCKPAVQAYQALSAWKERSENVDVSKLTQTLRKYEKTELADHVDALLLAEGEELMAFKALPASAISKPVEGSDATTASTDPIPNSKIMTMAKKIGPAWLDLAAKLKLPKEDIEDIKTSEGLTYHGAYRAIYGWKDMTGDDDIDQVAVLSEALEACGMADVVEVLKS